MYSSYHLYCRKCVTFLHNFTDLKLGVAMVLILDGNSEVGVHMWSDLGYLQGNFLGRERSHILFFFQKRHIFLPIRAKKVMRYHLI